MRVCRGVPPWTRSGDEDRETALRLIYGRSATHVAPRWRPGLAAAKTFASVVILFAVGLVQVVGVAAAQDAAPGPDPVPASGPRPDAAKSTTPSSAPTAAPTPTPIRHASAGPVRSEASPPATRAATPATQAAATSRPARPSSSPPRKSLPSGRAPEHVAHRSGRAKRAAARQRRARATRKRQARALQRRQTDVLARASSHAPALRQLIPTAVATHAGPARLELAALAVLLLGVACAALLGLVVRVDRLRLRG
jgi:hypothetical protein